MSELQTSFIQAWSNGDYSEAIRFISLLIEDDPTNVVHLLCVLNSVFLAFNAVQPAQLLFFILSMGTSIQILISWDIAPLLKAAKNTTILPARIDRDISLTGCIWWVKPRNSL
jgi:hypothetical protein